MNLSNFVYPIKFPISYGIFFLFPFLPFIYIFPNLKIIFSYYYPYAFICSSVGIIFAIKFLNNINKFIEFQKIYNDPVLTIYPKNNITISYKIHLLITILLKFLLITYWPFSISYISFIYSACFFLFMYFFNIFLYYY